MRYILKEPPAHISYPRSMPMGCWAACIGYITGLYDDAVSRESLDGLIASVPDPARISTIMAHCSRFLINRNGESITFEPAIFMPHHPATHRNLAAGIPQILALRGEDISHVCVLVGCNHLVSGVRDPEVWDPVDNSIKTLNAQRFLIIRLWSNPVWPLRDCAESISPQR